MPTMPFGDKVREVREQRKWDKAMLARETGVSSTYISKIEKGEVDLTIEIAGRIAKVLNIPLGEIFGEILTPEEVDEEIKKLLDESGFKIGAIDPPPVNWGYKEKRAFLLFLRDMLAQLAKKQKE